MADKLQIDSRRRVYSDYTDAQLINITYEFVPHSPQHIAAQQLLAERKERKDEERHQKIDGRLQDLKKPHWSTVPTFVLVVVALLVAIGAWLFPRNPGPESPKEHPISTQAADSVRLPVQPSIAPIVVDDQALPVTAQSKDK